jgi:acyl-CoA thioesterase FadM
MAVVTVTGAWIDLEQRRIVPPPRDLAESFLAMVRSEPFAELPAIRRR